MSVYARRRREYDKAWERGFTRFIQRGYEVGTDDVLSARDLQEGDTPPHDAGYEIIHSQLVREPDGNQVIVFTAMLEVTV
jgi:hypothetical protein